MASVRPARPPAGRDAAPAPPRRRLGPAAALAGIVVVAAMVNALLALHGARPMLFPDEYRYAHLARSLADGDGFTWRGADIRQPSALYIYFITPAWALFHSTVDAWQASKVLGTVAYCLAAVPVWLLARELMDARAALVPAALTVIGTWMVAGGELVTETIAYPLTTAALCFAALALRRPRRLVAVLAVVFMVLAIWARIQLAVLLPALFLAYAIDAVRVPSLARERLRARRWPLLIVGGIGLAVTIVAFTRPSLAGEYDTAINIRPALGAAARKSAVQLLQLPALGAFVPLALVAAATFSGRGWRDERTGPLLAIFWPVAVALAVESGWFLTTYPTVSAIERYMIYALPLAFVAATVVIADRRLLTSRALALGTAAMLVLLARPRIGEIGEERANWATAFRLHQLLQLHIAPALALAALLATGLTFVVVRRQHDPLRRAIAFGAVVAAVLVVQDQAAWHQFFRTASSFRATLPADLEWVDHHSSGPVALLGVTSNAPQFDDLDFFNRSIKQAYGPTSGLPGRAVQGKICGFSITASGDMRFAAGCGPPPTRFLINDPSANVTFYDETRSASDPKIGRVVEVAPGTTPRVQSLVVLPCPRPSPVYFRERPDIVPASQPISCRPNLTGNLWVSKPTTLEVRYRGGSRPQTVTVGTRRWALPPREVTTVRFLVPAGYSQFQLDHDWTTSGPDTPKVEAVELVRDGDARAPLLS